jgi:type II secretory pathway pseudopilin PulG
MRAVLKFITQIWSSLDATIQDDWATLASADNITYLNAAVRDAQSRARQNLGTRRSPADGSASLPGAATIDSVTAQPRSLVLDWSAGATAPQFAWRIHRSTTTGFTPDISNLIAVVDANTLTYTDTGLTAGTTYYYVVVGNNNNGDLGTESAEGSGTPT